MKHLINYLDLLGLRKRTASKNHNITITWSDALLVDNFKKNQFSKLEQKIAEQENVIYIFLGENSKGKKAIDVGQTSKSLLERTNKHLQDGDFLEGFPKEQKVYCGVVTTNAKLDKELLEQIEGTIIKNVVKTATMGGIHVCNESKVKQCKTCLIRCIRNKSIPNELKGVLRVFLINRNNE